MNACNSIENLQRKFNLWTGFIAVAPGSDKNGKPNKYPLSLLRNGKKPRGYEKREGFNYLGNHLKAVKNDASIGGVIGDGFCLIDIDNKQEAEAYLNYVRENHINTICIETTRGLHFYFRNSIPLENTNGALSGIGIRYDIKAPQGGKFCYALLKLNNTERRVIYASEEIDALPLYFLKPLKNIYCKARRQNFEIKTLYSMHDGDGRREYLLKSWEPMLCINGYSKEEIIDAITIIQNYILGEPLPLNDFRGLIKDKVIPTSNFPLETPENFPSLNDTGAVKNTEEVEYLSRHFKKRTPEQLEQNRARAKFLINKYFIRRERIAKTTYNFYFYEGGYYIYIKNFDYLKSQAKSLFTFYEEDWGDIESNIKAFCFEEEKPSEDLYLTLNNKILIFKAIEGDTGGENRIIQIEDHDPRFFSKVKLPIDYEEGAFSEKVDTFLNEVSFYDKEIKYCLEDIIAYSFYPRNFIHKAFFLVESGRNGKSTFCEMLASALGDNNTNHVSSIEGIEKDHKEREKVVNKLLIIGDDISNERIERMGTLKSIISGNTINIEPLYKSAYDFRPFCKCIFNVNKYPAVKDQSDGARERFINIPFNNHFSKEQGNLKANLLRDLTTQKAKSYLLNIALKRLPILFKECEIKEPKASKKLTKDIIKTSDPLFAFLYEYEDYYNQTIYGKDFSTIWRLYEGFCKKQRLENYLNKKNFTQRIKNYLYNIDTKKMWLAGKTITIFYAKDGKILHLKSEEEEIAEDNTLTSSENTEPLNMSEPPEENTTGKNIESATQEEGTERTEPIEQEAHHEEIEPAKEFNFAKSVELAKNEKTAAPSEGETGTEEGASESEEPCNMSEEEKINSYLFYTALREQKDTEVLNNLITRLKNNKYEEVTEIKKLNYYFLSIEERGKKLVSFYDYLKRVSVLAKKAGDDFFDFWIKESEKLTKKRSYKYFQAKYLDAINFVLTSYYSRKMDIDRYFDILAKVQGGQIVLQEQVKKRVENKIVTFLKEREEETARALEHIQKYPAYENDMPDLRKIWAENFTLFTEKYPEAPRELMNYKDFWIIKSESEKLINDNGGEKRIPGLLILFYYCKMFLTQEAIENIRKSKGKNIYLCGESLEDLKVKARALKEKNS